MPTASPDTQCNSHKADASHKPPTASESHYRLMIIVAAALSGSQRHKESEMDISHWIALLLLLMITSPFIVSWVVRRRERRANWIKAIKAIAKTQGIE
jgi:hypothetical protein